MNDPGETNPRASSEETFNPWSIVNLVFQCNGSCDVNAGTCSSVGPGRCDVNAGECHGACTVNLGYCAAGETCTLQIIVCNVQ